MAESELSLEIVARVDEVCDRFEGAWLAHGRPRIEDYLGACDGAERSALFRGLLALDLDYRRRQGDKPSEADYAERFREHFADVRAVFQQAASSEVILSENTLLQGPAGPIETPLLVPGYEILGTLGRGGMGVVYQARQTSLNRVVALKMILAGARARAEDVSRFRSEAEAVARLQHPNIVQVFEIGAHGGLPFFSLEFVEGGTLEKKLAGAPQPPREAAALIETLARAMHAAHQRGIVHRDLKPANVLLTADGTPKITDFGLAKRLETEGQTQTGVIMGTPSYMAPEQAASKRDAIGPGTDVYALGAILYEMLTGRAPFRGETPLDTVMQVIQEWPVPPGLLQPKLPDDLETICLKCLEKDPHRRYASAEALADDLRRFLRDEPIQARPTSRTEILWRWAKRNRTLAAIGSAAALLLLGTLITLTVAVILIDQAREDETVAKTNALELAKKNKVLAEKNEGLAEKEKALRQQAEQDAARLRFQQALDKCTPENADRGLLWLADALARTPEDDRTLQAAIRRHLGAWSAWVHPLRGIFDSDVAIFSPDGKTAFVGSDDRAAFWDVATGKALASVTLPSRMESGVFREDRFLALGFRWAQAFDNQTGKPLSAIQKLPGDYLALHPEGKLVLLANGKTSAMLWDLDKGERFGPHLLHQDIRARGAFSPDGKRALTLDEDRARLWKVADGSLQVSSDKHAGAIEEFGFLPDGKNFFTSHQGQLQIWDSETGKRRSALLVGSVISLAFHADGKTLATMHRDGLVKVWDISNGNLLDTRLDVGGSVIKPAWNRHGSLLLTSSTRSEFHAPSQVRLWDLDAGRSLGAPLRHVQLVDEMSFLPGDKAFYIKSMDRLVRLCDLAEGRRRQHTLGPSGDITHVEFQEDGKKVAVMSAKDGGWQLQSWEAATGKPIGPVWVKHLTRPVGFARHANKLLLEEAVGNQPLLLDTSERRLQPLPLPHRKAIDAAAFHPGGKIAALASHDPLIYLWEMDTGKVIGQPLPHAIQIDGVEFNGDGRFLLTQAYDLKKRKTLVWTWKVPGGEPAGPVVERPGPVAAALSPDGKSLLTGGLAKKAQLWDVASGKPKSATLLHPDAIRRLSFSPDGRLFFTASHDAVQLWTTDTHQPFGLPWAHPAPILTVAFHPDSNLVATSCEDRLVRLWDVGTGKILGPPLAFSEAARQILFSPDGKALLLRGEKSAWLAPLPTPVFGSPERIRLWTEVIIGMELGEHGAERLLSADDWRQRHARLAQLGGPPL